MSDMNLYIIGPVTGMPDDNREEFERVQDALLEAEGINVTLTPSCCVHDGSTWERAMSQSIAAIMQWWEYSLAGVEPHGFGIAMLDGWEESRGAAIEHDLAASLGIPCKPWREWL